jgi:hypothetical protein
VEAARQRVAAEESAKWEARLAAEKEAGEKRVAEERKLIEQKIEQVRTALAERYEAGFRPLLRETEARHVEELHKVVALQVSRSASRSFSRAPRALLTSVPLPFTRESSSPRRQSCALRTRWLAACLPPFHLARTRLLRRAPAIP